MAPANQANPHRNRAIMGLLGRLGGTEQEFSVNFTPAATMRSPGSIRTDKSIAFLVFHFSGRITVGASTFTPLTDAVRYILQEIRVKGTHAQFGSQTIQQIRAKTLSDLNKIHRVSYAPGDAGTLSGTGNATSDLDIVWTLPLFPFGTPLHLAPLYCPKGPDWAGNLFVEFDGGDGTALGTTAANITFSAYGSASGNAVVNVSVVRPSLTVDLQNALSPALFFRTYRSLDSVVQGSNFTSQKISDLNTGKSVCLIAAQTGTLQTSLTSGVRAYASFSNAIVTRMFPSLDGKPLNNPYNGVSQREFAGWLGGAALATGYKLHSFLRPSGNPDAAFQAETLTSARRFELDGDVTGGSNQGLEVVQEELLGQPALS